MLLDQPPGTRYRRYVIEIELRFDHKNEKSLFHSFKPLNKISPFCLNRVRDTMNATQFLRLLIKLLWKYKYIIKKLTYYGFFFK